jgi:hypothetical protein
MKSQRIPIEWMGPATWRLPSGKALAEFALQAGFLAPLMLGTGTPLGLLGGRRGPAGGGAPRPVSKVPR